MDGMTSSSVFSFVLALLESFPVQGSDTLPRVNPDRLSTVTRCLAALASALPWRIRPGGIAQLGTDLIHSSDEHFSCHLL